MALAKHLALVDRLARHPFGTGIRALVAAYCLLLSGGILRHYPLPAWPLTLALVIYGAALLRWPIAWLVVVPAVLPAVDLAPWTGWIYIGESDLFILVTIGVLVLRAPPGRPDIALARWPRMAVLLCCAAYLVSAIVGLGRDAGAIAGSDNPYLDPLNALRMAKGFVLAVALFPFLRHAFRTRTDAVAWLGAGMLAGTALVVAAVAIERVLFVPFFDFSIGYRVVGSFASMHLGSGDIDVYLAMTLPFVGLTIATRQSAMSLPGLVVALGLGYAVIVTYSRSAYGASFIAAFVFCLGWMAATRARQPRARSFVLPGLTILLAGCIVLTATDTDVMRFRLSMIVGDLAARMDNAASGMAATDPGLRAALVGTGLGTYPRVYAEHADPEDGGTDFAIRHDATSAWLAMTTRSPLYFEQRLRNFTEDRYQLSFDLRAPGGTGTVMAFLCQKVLLYAARCREGQFVPPQDGSWGHVSVSLSTSGLRQPAIRGWLRRPVALSFADPRPGSEIEIARIRLVDTSGRDIVDNGDFQKGTSRWYFTDDDHLPWRMHNQYLMTLFEQGALGLAALLLLMVTALVRQWREARRGYLPGAAIAASIIALLCLGLFDFLLEAPRLQTLIYLICFSGLIATAHRPEVKVPLPLP